MLDGLTRALLLHYNESVVIQLGYLVQTETLSLRQKDLLSLLITDLSVM
ncbi:hypothetical protein SDC9_104452 [bioreactor metagenome]|uniref:Uncharacterized protein n=1 Tax=bioreactor metagenome TaxID=1076179 RepID=A0A645AWZ7_9ZZZZ